MLNILPIRLKKELDKYDCLECISCGQIISIEMDNLEGVMEKVDKVMKCCKKPHYYWIC